MDSKELRNLQEAYMEVVENQQQLDEGYKPPAGKMTRRVIHKSAKALDPRAEIKQGGPDTTGGQIERQKADKSARQAGKIYATAANHDPRRVKGIERANRERGKLAKTDPGAAKVLRKYAKLRKEEVSVYDIILSHLLDEGYAETLEAAEVIMVNMSEEWRQDIMEAEIEPPRERVGALTNIDIPEDEKEAARKRTLAKAAAAREKRKKQG